MSLVGFRVLGFVGALGEFPFIKRHPLSFWGCDQNGLPV